MIAIFTILHVIISLFLVIIVLLQSGKGAMMGASLGAGQQIFGGSGGRTFFTRATGILIGLFMANCIWIAWLQANVTPTSALQQRLQAEAPPPMQGSPAPGITMIPVFGTPGTPPAGGTPGQPLIVIQTAVAPAGAAPGAPGLPKAAGAPGAPKPPK